jgi:uncharacterized protein GlcG (DUF336 family)
MSKYSGRKSMRHLTVIEAAVCTALVLCSTAFAQQPAAPAAAPTPPAPAYGPPITLDQAKKAVDGANTKTRPYLCVFAVVDPSGSLVYFEKMDSAPYSSVDIAIGNARTSAIFKRPSIAFFNQMESGHTYVTTLPPGIVASGGGLPLIADGKIIGAIGVSGGPSGVIDEVAAQAGVDTLK